MLGLFSPFNILFFVLIILGIYIVKKNKISVEGKTSFTRIFGMLLFALGIAGIFNYFLFAYTFPGFY